MRSGYYLSTLGFVFSYDSIRRKLGASFNLQMGG